eukprot:255727_1
MSVLASFLYSLLAIQIVLCGSSFKLKNQRGSHSIDSKREKEYISKPKNVILMISDGLGINANTAYRLWKDLDSTIYDDYLVGEFSVYAVDQTVPDSAATATAFSSGILPPNGRVGTDHMMNPIPNILQALKLQGKGVGVISTARVTHATPAAFTAHSLTREWEDLIAYQQAMRINSDVDILFGGGLRHFDGSRNTFNLLDNYKQYGWNSVPLSKDELLSLQKEDIPAIGLFSSSSIPSFMVRNTHSDLYQHVPDLVDMTKKTLEILSDKFDSEGFFVIIESAQPDWGAHSNDLAYLMHEVDEYMMTVDYVINEFMSQRDDDDTLILMLSDHETGGLSLGRASQWDLNKLVPAAPGQETFDQGTIMAQALHSFDFDPLVPAPPEMINDIGETSMYQFFTEPLNYARLPAQSVAYLIQSIDPNDVAQLAEAYDVIEEFYIEELTEFEKEFIKSCYSRAPRFGLLVADCLCKILSVRCNAGWTTHGHTANDVRVSANGPGSDLFRGFNGNIENIAKKMIGLLDVSDEMEFIKQNLKELFLSDTLEICDETEPLGFHGFDVGDTIPWPVGNYKYPGFCVEEFVSTN